MTVNIRIEHTGGDEDTFVRLFRKETGTSSVMTLKNGTNGNPFLVFSLLDGDTVEIASESTALTRTDSDPETPEERTARKALEQAAANKQKFVAPKTPAK